MDSPTDDDDVVIGDERISDSEVHSSSFFDIATAIGDERSFDCEADVHSCSFTDLFSSPPVKQRSSFLQKTYKHFMYLMPNKKGKPDRSLLPVNTKKLHSSKNALIWKCTSHMSCNVRYSIDTTAKLHKFSGGDDKPSFEVRVNNEIHGDKKCSPKHGIDLLLKNQVRLIYA